MQGKLKVSFQNRDGVELEPGLHIGGARDAKSWLQIHEEQGSKTKKGTGPPVKPEPVPIERLVPKYRQHLHSSSLWETL